ncbi:hypothetical protein MUK42_32690, partial [Musa troglodytarum]
LPAIRRNIAAILRTNIGVGAKPSKSNQGVPKWRPPPSPSSSSASAPNVAGCRCPPPWERFPSPLRRCRRDPPRRHLDPVGLSIRFSCASLAV